MTLRATPIDEQLVLPRDRNRTVIDLATLSLLCILLLGGCSSTSWLQTQARPKPKPLTPSTSQTKPLPAQESAKLCLATAQQLDAHGREAEAILQYERALKFRPNLPGVSRRLAVLYDRQQRYQDALASYQRAIEATPEDASLWNDYGYFYYQREHWQQAESAFRQAIRFDRANQRAWNNLALTLGQQGRYEESFQIFRQHGSEATAHYNVGTLLARHGKLGQAQTAFAKAMQLEPSLPQPQAMLAHLNQQSPNQPPTAIARRPQPSR